MSSLRTLLTRRSLSTSLFSLLLLNTSTLTAQEQAWRGLGLLAGPAEYDLSGTGWSWAAAARMDLPVGRMLIVEPGLGFFTYEAQSFQALPAGTAAAQSSLGRVPRATEVETTDRNSLLLPEVSLQLQYPGHRIRPYIGAGAGGALAVQGSSGSDITVHGALGLRATLGRSWTIRGEGRARNISGFEANNSIVEFLVGVNRQL